MSEELKLLPCPHCGTTARLVNSGQLGWSVYCESTFCTRGVTSYSDREAAGKWNRRAPIPAVVEVTEEMVERFKNIYHGIMRETDRNLSDRVRDLLIAALSGEKKS